MDSYGGLGMLRSTRGENSRSGERVRRTLQRCQEDIRHFLDTNSYQLIGVAREVSLTDAVFANQKLTKELEDLKVKTDASRIHIECDEKYRLLEEELDRVRRAAKIEQSTLESKVNILATRNRELTETVMTFTQQKPITPVTSPETEEQLRSLREEVSRLTSRLSHQQEQQAVEKSLADSARDSLEAKVTELESQLATATRQREEKATRLATVEADLAEANLKIQQLQSAAAAATSVICPPAEEKSEDSSSSALFWKEQFDGAKARLVELEASFSQVGRLKAEVAITQARLQATEEEWRRAAAVALGLPEDDEELGAHSIEESLRKEVERRVKEETANKKSSKSVVASSAADHFAPADEDDGLLGLFGEPSQSVGTKVMTLGANPHRQIAIKQHYETQLQRLKARNAQLETAMKTLMGEIEGTEGGETQTGDADMQQEGGETGEDDPTQKAVGVAKRLREIEQQLEKSRKLVDRLKTANLVTQKETAEVIARVLGWRVVRQDATAFWRFIPCTVKTDNGVPIHDSEDYFDVFSNEPPPLTDEVATLPGDKDPHYQDAISKVLEVPKWMLDVNAAPEVTNGVQTDPEQNALLSLESLPVFFARFTYMRYINADSFRVKQ